ncbi:hypothetical protein FS749_010900 [Ceratobasidium sp. UAMH 11750]|nr:hypothetical protein FS749_010900 [Ceratobasidium sp. UAMH 11750]
MSAPITPTGTQQPAEGKEPTRKYTLPNDDAFWVTYRDELFAVHRAILIWTSPVLADMIQGNSSALEKTAASPPQYLEGSTITHPLCLDAHGSVLEWNQFFDYIYPPHYTTPPPPPSQEDLVALLTIAHKYNVPRALDQAKAGLINFGMTGPLQLSLGRQFGFDDWVARAARRIDQIPLDTFSPSELQLLGAETVAALIGLMCKNIKHRLFMCLKLPVLLSVHAPGCRDQAQCLTRWKDVCLLLTRHILRPVSPPSDSELLAIVETDDTLKEVMAGMSLGCVQGIKDTFREALVGKDEWCAETVVNQISL